MQRPITLEVMECHDILSIKASFEGENGRREMHKLIKEEFSSNKFFSRSRVIMLFVSWSYSGELCEGYR